MADKDIIIAELKLNNLLCELQKSDDEISKKLLKSRISAIIKSLKQNDLTVNEVEECGVHRYRITNSEN